MKKNIRQWLAGLTAAVTAFAGMAMMPPASSQVSAANKLLAFPGAGGAGRYATGGRGGEVYHVTNLNDSGAGSFRDAVSQSGRIVVFDVSGTIELKSNILCQSNVTIAGQTAPGGSGITLKNYKMGMSGDNIICRYISSRPGPYASTSSGNDAWGGAKGSNSIIDHCSMGWTTDEQWGLYSNNEYYTVQYSVLGPADSWGGHAKGLHGFGIMMGKGNLTFDHNLIIHNVSRNFRGKVQDTKTADFTNNIIYDWGYQTAYGTIGHLNYVNNTLKAGNSTTGGYHWMSVDSSTKPENFKVYCNGNQMIMQDGTLNSISDDNWSGVSVKTSIGITKDDLYSASPFATVVDGEDLSSVSAAESAQDSYEHVISFAGNGIAPELRTTIDRQCAEETRTGTGSCSGTAAYDASKTDLDKYKIQCGVTYDYPEPILEKTITDNDNDGMDDEWEELRGLDPSDPSDYKGDYLGEGYMNIEYYINDLTADSFPAGVVERSPETAALTGRSAFEQIEAESFDAMEGIRTEDTSDAAGGQNIGFVENGDYVMYKRLDFGDGAQSVTLRASGNPCTIEVCADSLNTPLAKLRYEGTGSFGQWGDVTFSIPKISGVHNLYLRFTGGEGYLMNLNWFTFGKERVPVNGKLIRDLQVFDTENAAGYAIAYNTQEGSPIFGDRDFTIVTAPDAIKGAEAVLTACNSKTFAGDCAAFEVTEDVDIYVALDSRVETVPAWLAGYTKTGLTMVSSNDVTFDLYQTTAKADESITLGTNGQSNMCVQYAVYLQPAAGEAPTDTPEPTEESTEEPTDETPETTTEPTGETPTEPTTDAPTEVPNTSEDPSTDASEQPGVIYGDLTGDNAVDILDVIALNKYLLGSTTLSESARANADVDQDGKLDPSDSLNILKLVVKLIDALPV